MFQSTTTQVKPIVRAALALTVIAGALAAATFPDPATDVTAQPGQKFEKAVFAGGCFWGVEAVFESLKGVSDVVSGYSGGSKSTAQYEIVSTGQTGHAESVEVTYDPAKISYGKLLKVYFSVVHDPTQLNRQGPDSGTQYRSSIFYMNEDQKRVAEAYVKQLDESRVFHKPIVTKIVKFEAFYPAEEHHQNFIARNPTYPYVVYNDLPKLEQLRKQFPDSVKK